MTTTKVGQFCVEYWGSDPALDNDNCWTGSDHNDLMEAIEAFLEPVNHTGTEFVILSKCVGVKHTQTYGDIPVLEEIQRRINPNFDPNDVDSDDHWRREQAMQAGMAFGCNGYNDVMGY